MQSKPKANSIVTHEVGDNGIITFHVLGIGALTFNPEMVSQPNRLRAERHGWIQRIVDAAAIGMTDSEGNIIPKEQRNRMKYHAMNEIIVHYESGSEDWSRVGGGGGARSLTIEAIARVFGIEYEAAVEKVEKMAADKTGGDTRKVLNELRRAEAVINAMNAIRAERTPKPSGDANALLDELKAA